MHQRNISSVRSEFSELFDDYRSSFKESQQPQNIYAFTITLMLENIKSSIYPNNKTGDFMIQQDGIM